MVKIRQPVPCIFKFCTLEADAANNPTNTHVTAKGLKTLFGTRNGIRSPTVELAS